MGFPIEVHGFEGRGLARKTSGWLRSGGLLLDGRHLKGPRGGVVVHNNTSSDVTIQVVRRPLDPIPNLMPDGLSALIARPLALYE